MGPIAVFAEPHPRESPCASATLLPRAHHCARLA
jgi:hypothetical protein